MMLGGLEAGGTKFVCVAASSPEHVLSESRFPTGKPDQTLSAALAFFAEIAAGAGGLDAVGIACFGPLELRPSSPRYGFIASTPKPGWSGTDVLGRVTAAVKVPVGFDTDVNGAALGEGRAGAARGLRSFVYLTVGTGIGGGALVGGALAHGLVHPEMGHVSVPRMPGDDYPGGCDFHRDCLEGMASGPALAARWGRPAEELREAELAEAVELEAFYLAAGLRSLIYALAPERVVIGGGVAQLPGLLPQVRVCLQDALAGYPGLTEHAAPDFIVPAALGGRAGAVGALVLAERAARRL